ncbi:single-stranded DNA-binding protein, partial [Acinetobacter baumannii]
YLGKGSKVYVDGPTRHEKWTDSENQERSSTYVEADRVIFLDPKATGAAD